MVHVTTSLAFQPQSLFLCCFSKFMLKRIFLSTITLFFTLVVTFAPSKSSTFTSLIEGYNVNSVSFTFRTVCIDFLRNVHVVHYQLCIKETYSFLYLFTYKAKTEAFSKFYLGLPTNVWKIES